MNDNKNCFKEAVCVEVQRVFDSCSDKDCIFELPVQLCSDSQEICDEMNIVKIRCAEIEDVCISLDCLPFKTGYYSVDITYKFKITAEAFTHSCFQAQSGVQLCGTAYWNKRVILFGGEGNAKVFTSDKPAGSEEITVVESGCCDCNCCCPPGTVPKALVRAVEPIALDAKIVNVPVRCGCDCDCDCDNVGCGNNARILCVTLGLFSIIQLTRPVSAVIPVYDYCVPCKDCAATSPTEESPCEIFDRIDFPIDRFFPSGCSDDVKCGSCK